MGEHSATIDMGRNVGVTVPLLGAERGPHHHVAWAEAYLHTNPNPSNRLATIHQRHRQRGHDRRRSDNIERTVLQTVAQNSQQGNIFRYACTFVTLRTYDARLKLYVD